MEKGKGKKGSGKNSMIKYFTSKGEAQHSNPNIQNKTKRSKTYIYPGKAVREQCKIKCH